MTQSKTQSSALAVGEAWCLVWTHTSGRPASQPLPRLPGHILALAQSM